MNLIQLKDSKLMAIWSRNRSKSLIIFWDFFANVDHDYAKHCLHLDKVKQSKSMFITPTYTEDIRQILGKLKCKNGSGHLVADFCVSW